MPADNAFLGHVLTRWTKRSSAVRSAVNFQKELIEPVELAANGNRLAMRERRRRDLRHLEQVAAEAETRWEERLNRIEEWKKTVAGLEEEKSDLFRLIRGTLWLHKARNYQDTFTQRMERRAALLQAQQRAVHEKLAAWGPLLEERETALRDMINRGEPNRPFFVSRARKEPENEFIKEQFIASEALGEEIKALRRSLGLARGRVYKAFRAVEEQSSGPEILYEVHKQEILSALKGLEKILLDRREDILNEALAFEAHRSLLRRVYQYAAGLRCVEDLPKRKSLLKRLFPVYWDSGTSSQSITKK